MSLNDERENIKQVMMTRSVYSKCIIKRCTRKKKNIFFLNKFYYSNISSLLFCQVFILCIALIDIGVIALSCYECENCISEHPAYLNEKVKECPDNSYVSCLKTESKFAHYTIITRSCSQAPALNEDSCSNHVVNIMRARVCLCRTSLCNGLNAFKNAKGREEFDSDPRTTGSGSGSIHQLSSIGSSLPSFGTRMRSNTVLMHYDGGSSGYGSGGSLVNTLFPKYKHHKLNLNSLKNYGNEVLKKMNEKNAQNRNRLNHQINYNDNNGLIGITTSSTISHHVNIHFSFYTWLGHFTQQKIQMRTLSIHFPIAIITYFLSLCIISLRN